MSTRFLSSLLPALIVLIPLILPQGKLSAQTIPVGDIREDHYRIMQLFSDSTAETSFMNRPVWMNQYRKKFNEIDTHSDSWWAHPIETPSFDLPFRFSAGIYEPVITQTFNSALPHGGNNGAAWYGRGLNSELRAGFYLTSDYLTITFRPHLAWQQNRGFDEPRFIQRNSSGEPTYQGIVTNIDNPFRFGPDPYSTFDWGDSSIRLHYRSFEAGASTESLWWGPGIRNALVMSNNAPGIKQLFAGTRYPLKLPLNIGKIEFRFVAGWPDDSDYYASQTPQRFMSALHVIYSPSFLPGLHVGANRLTHMYVPEDGLTAAEIFTSQPFAERQLGTNNPDENEMASIFFRWVFPRASAEIYGSYFREDSFYDSRDLYLQIDHDRAYTIGFQKLVHMNRIDFIRVNLELSNLVPNRVQEVRPQTYYYRHSRIRQGHTNRGHVLGAEIGPGSGSQYLGVDGFFKKGMLGIFFQRVEDNDYFHYRYYNFRPAGSGYKDIWRNRVDINYGVNGLYKFSSLILEGGIIFNHNLNYGRYDYGDLNVTFDTFEPNDILNVRFQLSARYLF
jgi:hypothetical protein